MRAMRFLLTALALVIAAPAFAAANETQTQTPARDPSLPPDEESAKAALETSPRHGEMVDVTLTGGPPIRTWIAYPERKDKAGVVLIIHEIFGLSDWIRGVADQLAKEGFIAVAPDLISGMGPGGGGQSFAYAASDPPPQAAVVYYGVSPDSATLLKVKAPVLGLYGGDDARVDATIEPAKASLGKQKKTYDPHIFEGAGHGFLRQQTGRDGANLKATKEAWPLTTRFLRKYLE